MPVREPYDYPPQARALTEPEYQAVVHYVAGLLRWLRLDHWVVGVDRTPVQNPNSSAEVSTAPESCRATISLCPEWAAMRPEAQVAALIHEVLHLLSTEADRVARQHLSHEMHAEYRQHVEVAVDHLSWVLAEGRPEVMVDPYADGSPGYVEDRGV